MLPSENQFDYLKFDPAESHVVRNAPGNGYGYWAGGHKAFYDDSTGQIVLFYRERTPLEFGRGGKCAIAVSDDGFQFRDVWSATKDQFASSSIEVGHCIRDLDGRWRLYVSYEVAGSGYWRIDLIEADTIEGLSVQSRRTVLQPGSFGMRSIKDPYVVTRDGEYQAFVIGGARTTPTVEGDVITAGGGDATLVARSSDGRYFTNLQYVFEPPNTDTWHGRRARINSFLNVGSGYVGFYDGGRSFYDTYEEWTGLAWSEDGFNFARLDQSEPWIRSPYGCVRYVCVLQVPDAILFYFEYTNKDGSHDLRVARVDQP